jgi:Domain of Unknown Function (DUF1080)
MRHHHPHRSNGHSFSTLLLASACVAVGCGSSHGDPAGAMAGSAGGAGTGGGSSGPIPASGWGAGIPLMSDGKPITFYPALDVPILGNWEGQEGLVAQVSAVIGGGYQANLLHAFSVANDMPFAVLQGTASDDTVTFIGAGWSGTIAQGHFTTNNGNESFDLTHATDSSTTLGAAPPAGATVLFDGTSLDAWSKKNAANWLVADGPAQWTLVEGDAVEVVPGTDSIITNEEYGDYRLHVEFRTMGNPTNSGVFLMARYESNINEVYGRYDGNATAGFDNCTPSAAKLEVRASLPPLAWQTLDIDFRAPRFDVNNAKTESAHATVELNGVRIYDQMLLDLPTGAAGRFGEKATGPIMLQEHGMPVQFRNVWLVPTGP